MMRDARQKIRIGAYPFNLLPFHPLTLRSLFALLTCLSLCAGVLILPPPIRGADNKTRNRAERAVREGDFDLAEKLYRELLQKDAHSTEARLGLSFTLFKKRNLRCF